MAAVMPSAVVPAEMMGAVMGVRMMPRAVVGSC